MSYRCRRISFLTLYYYTLAAMGVDQIEPNTRSHNEDIEIQRDEKHAVLPTEALGDKELLAEAYSGETSEHQMGPWLAAKTYPLACLWAFTMAFTIVREPPFYDARDDTPR